MKKKVIFICKKRIDSYGNSFGLLNSATFVSNFLNSINIESKVVTVVDANKIDYEATSYDASHVFIEALFVAPEKMREILSISRHSKRKWIVRIHSRIPFLANEGIALKWISGYSKLQEDFKNLYLAPNDRETNEDFKSLFKEKWVYLPNIYQVLEYKLDNVFKKDPSVIDVGCFGAIRPMKNHLMQAIAAIQFAKNCKKRLRFHVNANRTEQRGDQVLKNMRELFDGVKDNNVIKRFELIEHKWLCHKDFINLIKNMDIGLQVSFSESFNIVAADFVANGVPIVVSPEIRWANFLYKADPNSSKNIADTLELAFAISPLKIHNINKIGLYFHNYDSKTRWKKFLDIC